MYCCSGRLIYYMCIFGSYLAALKPPLGLVGHRWMDYARRLASPLGIEVYFACRYFAEGLLYVNSEASTRNIRRVR